MSATAKKLRLRVRPGRPRAGRGGKPTLSVVARGVDPQAVDAARPSQDRPSLDRPSLDRLREAAAMEADPLPRRAELEALFDADLSGVELARGAAAVAALDAMGAEAAAVDGRILARPDAGLAVLAHEVTHLLQAAPGGAPADRVAPQDSAAEREANAVETRVQNGAASDAAVAQPVRELAPGEAALKRGDDLRDDEIVAEPAPAAAFDKAADAPDEPGDPGDQARAAPAPQQADAADGPGGAPQPDQGAERVGERGGERGAERGGDLGADIPDAPVPTFAPPAMPEIKVDEAAAAAAQEAAQEKLAAADDADALMDAYKDAPPSVKAQKHDALEGETARLSAEEQQKFDAEMPKFDAEMSGEDDLPAAAPVQTPEARAAALETPPEGQTPKIEIDPTPTPKKADVNRTVLDFLKKFFSFGGAEGVGRTFAKIGTSDKDVDTSAGKPPKVPLKGATDPKQVADRGRSALEDSTAKRREATKAVLDGPGPEQVRLKALKEENRLDPRAAPDIAQGGGGVEGASDFRDKTLDPVVVALFDQEHAARMSQSLTEAQGKMQTAVGDRDRDRDASVKTAEADRKKLNAEADKAQRDKVKAGRDEIQTARQTAVDEQDQHVKDLKTDTETNRKAAEKKIDDEVSETERKAGEKYVQAEKDSKAEVEKGEKKAEAEKQRQKSESKKKSWWDRATDWVAEQFDKLTKFINDVFDAVRSLVKGIIDLAKKAVVGLIDLAATAIKSAIKGFGKLLKAGVNALLSKHFPGVAKALNKAIDKGVEVASKAVDVVADGLKKGITALLDALGKALDAVLAAYQAIANAALALAKAAITGDWAAVAKMILEPILKALGINPADFYAMIAKAVDALGDIIDDPVGFLGNLVKAVVGGFRKFGKNILVHLQKGVIGWLTGAMAGTITMPKKFDLMGLLDLGRQILGLTIDMFRRVAVRILGEKAVARIEFFVDYAKELITGGWGALWKKIMADLGNLRDMIFGQIKEFVLTRIIIAGVTWLASLFNPVGALIKLVMTIWNVMMFLKDQFMRIIEVMKTIIGFMYDIAKGVIEPAATGVEKVLGNLVPIVLDLIARLLGLGNVAGKVRKIIAKVRQKIEDAIVKLIRKVIARFTGKGKGGGKGAAKGKGANEPLMKPLTFSGGGQSHTLLLKARGMKAIPVMRSIEQPVETWLRSLGTAAGIKAAVNAGKKPEHAIDDAAAAKLLPKVQPLAKKALGEESTLEREGSEEQKEQATGKDNKANDREVTDAAAKLNADLSAVLKALGLGATQAPGAMLDTMLAANMHPALIPKAKIAIRGWKPAQVAGIRDWAQFRVAFAKLGNASWVWPFKRETGGVLRVGALDAKVLADIKTAGEKAATDNGKAELVTAITGLEAKEFAALYFFKELHKRTSDHDAIVGLLTSDKTLAGVKAHYAGAAKAAVLRLTADKKGPDEAFKKALAGSAGKALDLMRDAALGRSATYVSLQDPDNPKSARKEGTFLQVISSDAHSYRYTRNRAHLSDRIRAVKPGNHEWIQGELAAKAIEASARSLSGLPPARAAKAAAGVKLMIDFQNKVRTPTSDLIFKPTVSAKGFSVTPKRMDHLVKDHVEAVERSAPVSKADMTRWYGGAARPKVNVLQGHAGGLKARTLEDGAKLGWTTLQSASPAWHKALRKQVANYAADDSIIDLKEFSQIRDNILAFGRATLWEGAQDLGTAPKGDHFDLYFLTSHSRNATYAGLKADAKKVYDKVLGDLETDMKGFK